MQVKEINEILFDQEVMNEPGIVVAKFYGSWCGPCKMVDAIIHQMPDFDGLKMVSIDVDKNITLAKQFGVMAVPSFVVFKEGAYVDKFTGFRNQAQLTEIFEKYIASGK